MRIGNNPEKKILNKIAYKKHRVIIPVYIPDSDDKYFSNLFEVFKVSIQSLLKTIDIEQTLITVINNNCRKEVTDFIDDLLVDKLINKHVKYSSNYGKIYTILSEAKSSYEDYITIADADVFYFSGWEKEVLNIFNAHHRAGVVSPVPAPHLTFYHNNSLFGALFKKYKKGNVLDEESFELFEQGINNPEIFKSKKYNWKKSQFYLEEKNVKACIGSGHFVATYNKEAINGIPLVKPKYVFFNGDEGLKLDKPIDVLGYYRLSTTKSYAYHLGNVLPNWLDKEIDILQKNKYTSSLSAPFKVNQNKFKYLFKLYYVRFLRKFKFL